MGLLLWFRVALLTLVVLVTMTASYSVLMSKKQPSSSHKIRAFSKKSYLQQQRQTTRQWALKDGAQAQIDEYRKQLTVYDSSPAEENSESEEEIKNIRTIISCANALVDIDRDILTFQEHLEGDDDRLKDIARSFWKEFLECKEQIETQLNSLL
jgi:hypothetical protein